MTKLDDLSRVAEVYSSAGKGGLDAVVAEFGVGRATAARWIAKARGAGLLSPRPHAVAPVVEPDWAALRDRIERGERVQGTELRAIFMAVCTLMVERGLYE